MADTKTLDEHAETVKRLDAVDARLAEVFGPRPESVRAVRDAYEAERAARVAARAALQGVADVVDPNGDHYFWRKKEADLAGTVKSIMEDRERIDAEWRKRAQLGMCVMDAPNGPECWCGAPSEVEAGLCLRHARELERLSHAEKAEARARELEARHAIRERVFDACARVEVHQRTVEIPMWRERAQKAEASAEALETERLRGHNILVAVANALGASGVPAEALPAMVAETRTQLARLREAAENVVAAKPRSEAEECAIEILEAVLSTPGPALAEIRREAQVEALRAAADRHTTPDEIRMWLRQRADEIEKEAGR